MDFEALARSIVEQVLAELKAAPPRELVLVLAQPDFARASRLEEKLRAALGNNVELVFHGGAGAESCSRYVLPYLCCPDMAAMANGMATGPMTRAALDLLLAGKTVEVLDFEYLRHGATAPQALYSLYENYAKTLASYGLVKFEEKKPARIRVRESLVTEKTVKEAFGGGVKTLLVPAGAMVTALAQDAAKELGLEILKDGGL